MRIDWKCVALAVAIGAPAIAGAQTPAPCTDHPCNIVFDWGNGNTPDVDRKYGAPSELENAFIAGLQGAGWRFVASQSQSSMTITVRLTPQNRALCDTMPGVNPDYKCHTVARGAVVFTPLEETQKQIPRIDINPRCSDPKNFPSFPQFGRYAAEYVLFTMVGESKGSRPSVKCA